MSMNLPNRYQTVSPGPQPPEILHVIVEIPKGRRSKFEVDKETGLLRLDRFLYTSASYPGDYGFIPQTLAEDGDPLDVVIMLSEPTFSGCLVEARPLGLFKMTDGGHPDYKVLCVPSTDPLYHHVQHLSDVPPHFLREAEHFFAHYKDLEHGGDVVTQGWHDVDEAFAEINASIERYWKKATRTSGGKAHKAAAKASADK